MAGDEVARIVTRVAESMIEAGQNVLREEGIYDRDGQTRWLVSALDQASGWLRLMREMRSEPEGGK